MAAPGATVGPGDATAFATGGAAAVVVDTSVVALLPESRPGCSVKRGIEPKAVLAEMRVMVVLRPVRRHVVLDLPVFLDVTVRHVDVVSTQRLYLPICRHLTVLTMQIRTPLIIVHVTARFVQRLVVLLGVHVKGARRGAGGAITGVPPADAAWTAGEAVRRRGGRRGGRSRDEQQADDGPAQSSDPASSNVPRR